MAGGQLGSPNCDGVVLNSFNSPRFDISEFLKTPKDSTSEEPFFNFAGFNIPTPTFNLLNPLPPFNSRRNPRGEGSEPDFSALLFDKGVESEGTSVDDTLNGELIAFDEIDADIAKDSFALFSGTHENFLNHPISPLRINVPYHSAGTRIPLNFPPPMFTQGSYLGGEPGGLMEVEDRALASMEHGASTSGGANPLMCPSTPMDWSMPREGALQTNSSQQHNTLQCDSCQILRRIIHSNGLLADSFKPSALLPFECASYQVHHTSKVLSEHELEWWLRHVCTIDVFKIQSLRFMGVMVKATMLCCRPDFVLMMDFQPLWNNRWLSSQSEMQSM